MSTLIAAPRAAVFRSSIPTAASLAADAAPLAVRASRRVVLAASSEDDDTLRKRSEVAISELLSTDDAAEGLAAFAEKRAPRWQGR